MSSLKEMRMRLSEEDIKNILAKMGVFTVGETETALVFPTVCHNETGGSPKLYYYKNEKIFKCYTQCNHMFDIFTLIQKIDGVRGMETTLPQAIEFTGLDNTEYAETPKEALADLEYLRKLKDSHNSLTAEDFSEKIEILDPNLANEFIPSLSGLKPWLDEGISAAALEKYNIRYDEENNAITIPHYNEKGELIGIRGRFFGENAKAKYMPIKHKNRTLSHPVGRFLYGYHQNKETAERVKTAVIFEGEKSVIKMETHFPNFNMSFATSGKKITLAQLNILLKLKVKEIVLGYDKDYKNKKEMKEKIQEYQKIVEVLKPYFEVSILIDDEDLLGFKDSPIDRGPEIFMKLMNERARQ